MIDIKDKIRQSTSSEHDELIGIMKEGLHNEDPKVGIFGIIHKEMNCLM